MAWDDNPYYHPEKWDLEVLNSFDVYLDLSYEFDEVVVWKHKSSGKLYAARSAGCSCPVPFEEYQKLEDLTEIKTLADLESLIDGEYYRKFNEGGWAHLKGVVHNELKKIVSVTMRS